MFDFEKFPVYIKTKSLLVKTQPIVTDRSQLLSLRDQLYRASSSILLNLAEGAGKYGRKDKRKFYIIARGSVQECVAILAILEIEGRLSQELLNDLYSDLTEISKMLSGLIKKMSE